MVESNSEPNNWALNSQTGLDARVNLDCFATRVNKNISDTDMCSEIPANVSFEDNFKKDFEEMLEVYEENHDTVLNEDDIFQDDGNKCDEEQSENDNTDNNFPEGNQCVFPGSTLTLGASMLLIMTFALKYSLTGDGLKDLLSLICLHCPAGNLLPMTVGHFKKWFQKIKSPLKVHKYCSFCNLLLSEEDSYNGLCPNEQCKKNISSESVSHFIELPIVEQVKSFFSRPSFLNDIKHRFSREKKSPKSIEDIYDGQVYKSLSVNGPLNSPYNLSLLWNTDGIPCFKSSNVSLWPLYFQINELSFPKRSRPENMILGGLWFGPKKPTMMSFTEPFVKSLQFLETEGIQIETASESFNCKVLLIGGTADLPARSVLCNTVQFNGKYGCCKCLQPGETFKTSARGHVHVFPFKEDNHDGPKRTHKDYLTDVSKALRNSSPSNGVKGPSFLQCLAYYNMISGTCIDYMHGVLLGVTKLLLKLWFSCEHSSESFSLYKFVDNIDKRLKCIKPPNNITRLPRSIKEHLSYWKASELRCWLLYYSLPVLRDIQGNEYFQHYLLFVNAIYLLLQESIPFSDLQKSNELLVHFCCMFAALYGERYMTCNIHQLLHLSEMVHDMGPLWAYSCFPFENANGNLLKLFNGTQSVDFQIVEAVNLTQNLPYLQTKFLTSESAESKLYESMTRVVKRKDTYLYNNIYIVGRVGKLPLNAAEMEAVSQFLKHVPVHYQSFNRLQIGGEIFHSKRYARACARNSYTVAYKSFDNETMFCQVSFYLQLYPFCSFHAQVSNICKCEIAHVAVGKQLKQIENRTKNSLSIDQLTKADASFVNILHPACELEAVCVVPVHKIMYKCVFVEVNDCPDIVYACKMPNLFEKD